ncbi:heat-shock protein IbpA [Zobellella endophytica]|uniref:Heat-shock protein IbpA n=1 Tax=Zobellella endophytica TaxID=2116700 RepID=A0A2P7QTE8_9GAMM|nr:Hsp20 family protein [Zobellella endophytica]PSJ41236.1 heat-shock protein IbpA [Zobellella endophytica]
MSRFDFSPLYRSAIGFDRMMGDLEALLQHKGVAYPPYNIEKQDNDHYRISLAVAGFKESELSLSVEQNTLLVKGVREQPAASSSYLYQGITERDFELKFRLADHVQVTGARLDNGLLVIDLLREVPDELKPRRIDIGQGRTLEHKSE